MKKIIKLLTPITTITSVLMPLALTSCNANSTHLRLTRNDWEDGVKSALNECIATYGIDGKYYSKDNYVVFDFDNTSAIFDIAHQCTTYQIETMSYNLDANGFKEALESSLSDKTKKLSEKYDFSYNDLIGDIVSCYTTLLNKYGPFTYKGIDQSKWADLHKEDAWIDFSAKLRYLYEVVSNIEGDTNRCLWGTFQFSGMTPEQVYELEYKCLKYKSTLESRNETWTAKTAITNSTSGIIASATFIQGISVTENIKELYKALYDNGINIWIVSASQIDQVIAAADVFGVGQYVTGAIGLTNKIGNEGKFIPEYDYTNGKGYIKKDNKWTRMEQANPYITAGVGKSDTIQNTISPNYNNKGPIMCFGDSTGDFNFCSEFKDTKLVICFNRADRGVTDGGGLMSAIAMYQKLNGITLSKANNNNDTLYCLQGRDETGLRSFRNSNKTIKIDSSDERLFKNTQNYALLNYLVIHESSIKEACELSIVNEDKVFDLETGKAIKVGFLQTYLGYHKR